MNITELDNYKLAKAIDFNTDLNPQIFVNDKMRPVVREKLMEIADHFREFLGVQNIALVDIEVSGSNAAYSYTPHSDIDLHLIVDFTQLPDSDVYRELFDAKKYQYNNHHDIKIKGYEVELYVQDAAQKHHSLGSYSVLNDKWNKIPTKQRANLDDDATLLKYEKLKDLAIRALAADDNEYLNKVLDVVKKYRQAGLDQHGEFGPENLAFKMLRTDGYFAKLWTKKRNHVDTELSLETAVEEPDTLAQELMAEFVSGVSPQQTESMIKRMFKARSGLFEDFDYTYIQDSAAKLVTFEASYAGNLGAMEVMQFYRDAPTDHVDLLTRLIAADKTKEAWQLIQKVTGTQLQGQEFNESEAKFIAGMRSTFGAALDDTSDTAIIEAWDVSNQTPVPSPGYNKIIAMSTTVLEDGTRCTDMGLVANFLVAEASRNNPKVLESNTEETITNIVQELFNSMSGVTPVVGNSYAILQIIALASGESIILNGSRTPLTITEVNQKDTYVEYVFKTHDGIVRKFPDELHLGARVDKTFLFETREQLGSMESFLRLKMSNWAITDRFLTEVSTGICEDPMTWIQDDDQDFINPVPIITDTEVFNFMDEIDRTAYEMFPENKGLSGSAYGMAMKKARAKIGTVEQVPMQQIVSTEKYLKTSQLAAILNGKAKSSSDYPILYKQGNTYIAGDGNHRIAAQFIKQQPTIKALVLDGAKILDENFIVNEQDIDLVEEIRAEFEVHKNIKENFIVNEQGRIVKGSNTTDDVGVDEIKIQAKKMGFNVSIDGVPEIPKNGVPKIINYTAKIENAHASALREFLNSNQSLLESQDDFKSVREFTNSYKTSPIIGEKYVYTSLMITPAMGFINLAHTEEAELIKIKAGYVYFRLASGKIAQYPKNDSDLNSSLQQILFFKTLTEFDQFKAALILKFGQWRITHKLLEDAEPKIFKSAAVREMKWEDSAHIEYMDDRLAWVESQIVEGVTLFDSNSNANTDYFLNINSDAPVINKKFILAFQALVNNRIIISEVHTGRLIDFNDTEYKIKLDSGKILTYPDCSSSKKMLTKSFLFDSNDKYNKFRTIIQLKFKKTLPQISLAASSIQQDNLTESFLTELNMAPGNLQKAVNKILSSADPHVGVEFEVIMPADAEMNPEINLRTTRQDILDFFTYDDEESFENFNDVYQEWLQEQESAWSEQKTNEILNDPTEEYDDKREFMVDYTLSDNATSQLKSIYKKLKIKDDLEITDEIAESVLDMAELAYKDYGSADNWPTSDGMSPYVLLYHEIFVVDKEDATEKFKEMATEEFYSTEMLVDEDEYSIGAWLQSLQISSMGDLYREFDYDLTWTGGTNVSANFDEEIAYQIADELGNLIGEDVTVAGEDSDDSDNAPDTSVNWVITNDSSIRPNNDDDSALEIITPVMDYSTGIKTLNKVFDFLSEKNAYANDSTGLHINVSLGNIDHTKLNYTKLIVMLGDSHILKQYNREFNEYAVDALTNLSTMLDAKQGYDQDKKAKAVSFANMMGKMKSDFNNAVASSFDKIDFGKYNSIGLKDNYIEFRSGGGANYLDDFGDIVGMINRFVVAYAVAADPDAYKNEYGKKLYKLATNVGLSPASPTAMQLFAKFSSGMMTKEELIRQVKMSKTISDEPVDTGDRLRTAKSTATEAFIEISDKWDLSAVETDRLWNNAIAIELERLADLRNYLRPPRAAKAAYTNLMNDKGYYE